MPATIYARPDIGPPLTETTPVPAVSAWDQLVQAVTGWTATIPAWVWVTAIAVTLTAGVITFPTLRRQGFKAGQRAAGLTTKQDRRDKALLAAALTPAVAFWVAVLIGSARGLTAFGRDDLRWANGWEYLVPFTLDGVAVSFGLLAFRAIRKARTPDRAVRVAWGAMIASAAINFGHENGLSYGSFLGGAYLALMSLLGMLIFDELLAQFENGAGTVRRTNPKFGLRWITWPTNTVCAWFAWRNHPLDEGTHATIALAVEHLETVRGNKRVDRAAKVDARPWWTPLLPWIRVEQLEAARSEHRTEIASERTAHQLLAAKVEQLLADHNKAITELAERTAAKVEQARSEAAEQVAKIRAEHAAHVSRIREKAPQSTPAAPARSSAKTAPAPAPTESRLSNDEAVELMLATHPEHSYEWGQREVVRLTGAGFSRAPKLIAAVAERHARGAGAGRRSDTDDAEERAS